MPISRLYHRASKRHELDHAHDSRPLVAQRAHALALQTIPVRDLIAEIETARWLALDVADDVRPGGSRAVAELQLEALIAELERRQRLWQSSSGDPLRPAWPRRDPDLRTRVNTAKGRWPIARFCRELLACELIPAGRDRWKACCPLPGHDDKAPSFVVFESTDSAHCFGCDRGGDVIALTGITFGLERFFDRLERLEQESGVVDRIGA